MSTFLYLDGVMYADRLLTTPGSPPIIEEGKHSKITFSPDKQFAYAVSGDSVKDEDEAIICETIRALCQGFIAYRGDMSVISTDEGYENLHKVFRDTVWAFMFMNRDTVIVCRNINKTLKGESIGALSLRRAIDRHAAVGGGAAYLRGLIIGGVPVEEAYRLTHRHDTTTGLMRDQVKQDSLKPFVVRAPNKALFKGDEK